MHKGHYTRSSALLTVLLSGFLLPSPSHAAVTTWDLQANWDGGNPGAGLNAQWSYRNLAGGLFNNFQSDVSSSLWSPILLPGFTMSRWTDGANVNGLPGLGATTGNTCPEGTVPQVSPPACVASGSPTGVSWPAGSPNGSIGGQSYDIRWTAPFTGPVFVSADVWMMRNGTNNQQIWTVEVNGVPVGAAANIPKASRANGSGASAPLTLAAADPGALQGTVLNAGDILDFIVQRANVDQISDFVGIDIRIDDTGTAVTGGNAPEPATMGFMMSGLAAIGLFLRRKKT